MHLSGVNLEGARQQLEGMEITDSEFKKMDWEYSGGAFSFTNVTISAPMHVRFTGGGIEYSEAIVADRGREFRK